MSTDLEMSSSWATEGFLAVKDSTPQELVRLVPICQRSRFSCFWQKGHGGRAHQPSGSLCPHSGCLFHSSKSTPASWPFLPPSYSSSSLPPHSLTLVMVSHTLSLSLSAPIPGHNQSSFFFSLLFTVRAFPLTLPSGHFSDSLLCPLTYTSLLEKFEKTFNYPLVINH